MLVAELDSTAQKKLQGATARIYDESTYPNVYEDPIYSYSISFSKHLR